VEDQQISDLGSMSFGQITVHLLYQWKKDEYGVWLGSEDDYLNFQTAIGIEKIRLHTFYIPLETFRRMALWAKKKTKVK
jgi:hypothetical protein